MIKPISNYQFRILIKNFPLLKEFSLKNFFIDYFEREKTYKINC